MKFSDFCDFTKRYPNERVQVFVDMANLYKSARNIHPDRRVDYKRLAMKLIGKRKPIRITLYISTLSTKHDEEQARSQERFMTALAHIPLITVKKRPLRYSPNKKEKWEKGVDILLATDMLSGAYYDAYDSLVLISGDGDFAPVLEEIKKTGKRVENAFFKCDRSDALHSVCDIFVDLSDEVIKECLQKKPASPKGKAG